MQAVKNGIKSTLRTPGKTLLYSLVTLVLAVLLSVSFCVNAAVRGYLADCEDYFHTVINLEYVGRSYPDPYDYDPAQVQAVEAQAGALEALCRSEGVLRFEPTTNAIAQVEGLHRKDRLSRDPDAAVLCVYLMYYDKMTNAYSGTISSSLYSRTDESGKMVLIRTESMEDPETPRPAFGKTYLVAGHFFRGSSSYLWFQAEEMRFTEAGQTVTVPAFTPKPGEEIPTDHPCSRLAELMRQRNNACLVQYTAELEDRVPFHEQELTVTEGRSFTAAEYDAGAKVCVLPALLASTLELSPGSRIRLSVGSLRGDLYSALVPLAPAEDYEVVGIYSRNDSYPFVIYLPDSGAAAAPPGPVNGSCLGQLRVENAAVSSLTEQMAALEAHGFRLTVYDQGYAAASEPMQELLFLSAVFLAVCLLLTAAVLSLQCHMFITRQRETAGTMLALGSGRGHIFRYFLACTAVVVLPAIILGCLIGKALDRQVFRLLVRYVARFGTQDLRFSSSRLSLARTLEFVPRAPWTVYPAAGLTLLLSGAVFTLAFTGLSLRDRAGRKTRRRVRQPRRMVRRSSRLQGRLKYALLSIRRGGLRTAAVVLLAAAVALFLGQLTGSLAGYQANLEQVRTDTVLTGHATDAAGQRIDGLLVSRRNIDAFLSRDLVSAYSLSDGICHVRFVGIPETADGASHAVPEPMIPTNSFGIETLFGQMHYEPDWIRSSSVGGSARFYYTGAARVDWLPGYDESSFLTNEWMCALPRSLADRHGIQLGDTVRFLYAMQVWGAPVISTVDLRVTAIYQAPDTAEAVLSPIGCSRLQVNVGGFYDTIPLGNAGASAYDSFVFTLKEAGALEQTRQALEEAGFTYVHSGLRGRSFAVLDDTAYLNTTGSMARQIQYVTALYDVLYLLTGLLGLVLAWLMVSARRGEIALMRALGTQPGRIIGSFFLEQLLLCGAGVLLGTLIWRLTGSPISRLQLILTGAFLVLWVLSALICGCVSVRKQAYAALTEPE